MTLALEIKVIWHLERVLAIPIISQLQILYFVGKIFQNIVIRIIKKRKKLSE